MNRLEITLMVLGIIALVFIIIASLYAIASQRRKAIMLKKIDYLVEDLTYKSELLNPTVESVSKMGNYIDIFEVATKKNLKVASRVLAKNKDSIYKVFNKFKKAIVGKEENSTSNVKDIKEEKND